MRTLKKLTMTLALLIMAVSGAWAANTYTITFAANGNTKTVENVTLPKTFQCSYDNADGELDLILKELYGWSWSGNSNQTFCDPGTTPQSSDNNKVVAGNDNGNHYITINNVFEGTVTITGTFVVNNNGDKPYSLDISIVAIPPTEWDLTSQDGKNWILDKMPASNIELQVEYFAESNLFLSKNALADKTNIAVTAGELGVQFGNDGKSANTITEGTEMTVKYNGTKKVIGFKVAKAAAPVYTLLSAATTSDYGKVVCAAGHLHDAKTDVPAGCTAVGILGKVTATGHGLILSLKNAEKQTWNTINGWESVTTYAGTTLKVLPDDAARGTNLTSYTTLGETSVSNWAVAQKSDYEAIFTNLGSTTGNEYGKTFDANVNAYITTGVGGTALSDNYWPATEVDGQFAWFFQSDFWSYFIKTYSNSVRPVLGF